MSGVAGNPSVNGGEDVKSSAERARQTPLHAVHERLGATMTSFADWQMPLRYASETAEHLAVRRAAGLFDLSHMGEITVAGPGAGAALDYALVGNLSALRPGRAGYTGEDGFEVFCRPEDAVPIWEALTAGGAEADSGAGLVPAGLAARDTLRLEAGMPLYGNELGPDVTPFEAGLGRVVKFDKPGEFVGREALAARAASGPVLRLAGLTVQSRRTARHGYPVLVDGKTCGTVTSGAPSPTLGVPIAMAFLEPAADDRVLTVGIRGQAVPAQLTDLPFYRRRH